LNIPFTKKIVIFGSRDFCFSYGLTIMFFGKFFKKACYIRFIGGRPMLTILERPRFLGLILLRVLRYAEKILIETEAGAREFPSFLRGRIEVVPGYRPRCHTKSTVLDDNPSVVRFVYGGAIRKAKGFGILIDAFSRIRREVGGGKIEVELHVYGAGCAQLIRCMDRSVGVYYHGSVRNYVFRKDLPQYDVFVFPSEWSNEGHPGVLIEALMAGLPVIASDLPCIKEVVKHLSNGLVFKAGDVNELTKAMESVAVDPRLRKRLARDALTSSDGFAAETILPKLAAALTLI
jgi:glycosyltransferase involved in cell wall biosynthesis